MPRWLPSVLTRIREHAATRRILFTLKARRELAAVGFGLDEQDAADVLAKLTAEDSVGRLVSNATGEWMYLFKPSLAGMVLYVKVILRRDCIVVSFHEDKVHEDNGGSSEEEDS